MNYERSIWADRLRSYLTILVIVHHAAIAYGAEGLFGITEQPTDSLSPLLLTLFAAVNQSFFMGLFFFISAYFAALSIKKYGAPAFLKQRGIRIGIPLAAAVLLIRPVISIIADRATGTGFPPESIAGRSISGMGTHWFLAALLLFQIIHASISKTGIRLRKIRSPGFLELSLFTAVLTAVTWAVRIKFPVGTDIPPGFQPAHFPQYITAYILGCTAVENGWVDGIGREKLPRIIPFAAALLILLPIVLISGIGAGAEITDFLGRGGILSLSTSFFDSAGFFCFGLLLVSLFKYSDGAIGSFLQAKAKDTFAVYFIHELVLIILIDMMLEVDIPTPVKFLLVSAAGCGLCFLTASLWRRLKTTIKQRRKR